MSWTFEEIMGTTAIGIWVITIGYLIVRKIFKKFEDRKENEMDRRK